VQYITTLRKNSYCSSEIIVTVNSLFTISRLGNCRYFLPIDALHKFYLLWIRQKSGWKQESTVVT